jgi:hypothetical protein
MYFVISSRKTGGGLRYQWRTLQCCAACVYHVKSRYQVRITGKYEYPLYF